MIIEVCTQGALPGGVVVFFWTLARLAIRITRFSS